MQPQGVRTTCPKNIDSTKHYTLNMSFRFKQFYIDDTTCSMKVGTDGVLVGAWTALPQRPDAQVLDIGTGSGLIALMIAQRMPKAHITAIDISEEATVTALYNFKSSNWAERLTALNISLQAMPQNELYDLIISNPPYFKDSLKAPDKNRSLARHTDTLSYHHIISYSAQHLSNDGILTLILPADEEKGAIDAAHDYKLYPHRICRVCTTPNKPHKRVMLSFMKTPQKVDNTQQPIVEELELSGTNNTRSEMYQSLTKDFYL